MPLNTSGSYGRFGQRDDRHRRLLTDELSNPNDWPACSDWPAAELPAQKSEHYGDADFLGQQLRLFDLIPRHVLGVALLLVVAGAIGIGLEAAYAWMLERTAHGAARVAALDLAAKGSLGCWFSSLMLVAAAVAALLVYSIRRHRIDDYQGRYRIWLSAAAVCFLLATDQAASLREAFRDAMIALTGTPLAGDGSLWWAVFYALLVGAVGSRLLMDMRPSLSSMGLLLMAVIVHTLAVVGQLGGWLPKDGHRVMYLTGAAMLGNLLLLATMTTHARHVILDAEGLLLGDEPPPEEKGLAETETAEVEEDAGDTRWMKIDAPHTVPPPAFQRAETSMVKSVAATSPSIAAGTSAPLNRKLTKAERRAMKERLLRERMQRTGS
jgi:hypothetical protein